MLVVSSERSRIYVIGVSSERSRIYVLVVSSERSPYLRVSGIG